ncbi:MAG: 50S ribosomal protein L25/general stress protein Ctc [Roseofilum sp. SBFL]|uniref:50S ribosomal protein L25/general stress protein Ctc n=1 Tax=unclassified Roseofilum TaxID=2620099 RepID=UPI001B2A5F9B|nr:MULTISPECIES: 50S ribosomal protein L25/general stress protein Ctc [unclassified Roseofilum]MBP0012146.1 50S ribosomal protein L25/general stress protein Ctc [Roseofilum sp. SID3]MBP0025814.1 50S ribosomal protein L25/general stress protein Ctc [Roseofilum sp. SID2]MBP0031376.1 50S ribosomal protein L25/general stress protein Ctc [Roseofilum sp. Guam]MBP0037250.1 50S ribosomal protein L25/general stress protein Ctc [Roseofilum sp. SID1]MBP0044128.1 50S ribosomal protein L25/general stress p
MELTIECHQREAGSKARALRRSGLIPANLYGHKGNESISLTVDDKTVQNLLKSAVVNNTLINVNIPELSWNGKALLREVQRHPWKGFPYHLSFFSIASQKSVEVDVRLNFVGEAIGVKQSGGLLDSPLSEVRVQCPPDRIPEVIDVDVTDLAVGGSLAVKDLNIPEGVKIMAEPKQLVVTVLASRVTRKMAEDENQG